MTSDETRLDDLEAVDAEDVKGAGISSARLVSHDEGHVDVWRPREPSIKRPANTDKLEQAARDAIGVDRPSAD